MQSSVKCYVFNHALFHLSMSIFHLNMCVCKVYVECTAIKQHLMYGLLHRLVMLWFSSLIDCQLTKFTKVREFPLLESALFFLMSYCSFQASEAADLTGTLISVAAVFTVHFGYNVIFQTALINIGPCY